RMQGGVVVTDNLIDLEGARATEVPVIEGDLPPGGEGGEGDPSQEHDAQRAARDDKPMPASLLARPLSARFLLVCCPPALLTNIYTRRCSGLESSTTGRDSMWRGLTRTADRWCAHNGTIAQSAARDARCFGLGDRHWPGPPCAPNEPFDAHQ